MGPASSRAAVVGKSRILRRHVSLVLVSFLPILLQQLYRQEQRSHCGNHRQEDSISHDNPTLFSFFFTAVSDFVESRSVLRNASRGADGDIRSTVLCTFVR